VYISENKIRDVKCFDRLTLDFRDPAEESGVRRWTVILGPNGLGKSTLLQAIAITLAGPNAMRELLPRAESWVRGEVPFGTLEATLLWTEGDAQLPRWPKKSPYQVHFAVTGTRLEDLPDLIRPLGTESVGDFSGNGNSQEREKSSKAMSRLKQTAYAEDKAGWLACGYGPFRRLTGGSQDADQILYAERRAARFVSLFREDAALSRAESWLVQLYNLGRDGDESSTRSLEIVKHALASDFLLESAKLEVDARRATLALGNSTAVPLTALSDGYRAMLALGLDLVRHLISAFPTSLDPLSESGVVLIDELDAHLHPNWQRLIGSWLLDKFPRVQFVVATHSPFLTQVWPESNFLLREEEPHRVSITHDERETIDWTVDQVMVELLGLKSPRSLEFEQRLSRYTELRNRRNRRADEQGEWEQLQLWADRALQSDESARRLLQSLVDRLPAAQGARK
jgi:hypothetical protein